ncbi:MAG: hypothetical protein EOP09_00305 [Proteobacteria bacterium]|nr:MAG: hypothetical protein EOP09_00305 [Pseudomonadota bacterium]
MIVQNCTSTVIGKFKFTWVEGKILLGPGRCLRKIWKSGEEFLWDEWTRKINTESRSANLDLIGTGCNNKKAVPGNETALLNIGVERHH